MRRSRNPTSSTTNQSSSLATGSSGNSASTNTVPSLLKELHGLVLQIQVMFRALSRAFVLLLLHVTFQVRQTFFFSAD